MDDVIIYYNLCCSNLCGVLEILCEVGIELVVVEYLNLLLDVDMLQYLFDEMLMLLCELLCEKEVVYVELGFDNLKWSVVELIDFMVVYLVFINWFIVVMFKGVCLCWLLEIVCEIFQCIWC